MIRAPKSTKFKTGMNKKMEKKEKDYYRKKLKIRNNDGIEKSGKLRKISGKIQRQKTIWIKEYS